MSHPNLPDLVWQQRALSCLPCRTVPTRTSHVPTRPGLPRCALPGHCETGPGHPRYDLPRLPRQNRTSLGGPLRTVPALSRLAVSDKADHTKPRLACLAVPLDAMPGLPDRMTPGLACRALPGRDLSTWPSLPCRRQLAPSCSDMSGLPCPDLVHRDKTCCDSPAEPRWDGRCTDLTDLACRTST